MSLGSPREDARRQRGSSRKTCPVRRSNHLRGIGKDETTMRRSKGNRILLTGGVLAALAGIFTVNAGAMHIAEGYLPVNWCCCGEPCVSPLWWRASSPSRGASTPLPGPRSCWPCAGPLPSCSPPEDPLLQRLLLPPHRCGPGGHPVRAADHGGAGAHRAAVPGPAAGPRRPHHLGANTFSMAIAGPILSWVLYKLLRKVNAPASVAVFAAAALGTCSPTWSPPSSWASSTAAR